MMSRAPATSEVLKDYSSDEEPLSPTYGALGITAVRQRNGTSNMLVSASLPSEQRSINVGKFINAPVVVFSQCVLCFMSGVCGR